MGFAGTLEAIIEHLPLDRQTLLFSATMPKRVKDLARLALKTPEYVAADEASMPVGLEQHYMVVPLESKIDRLFSFLKVHPSSKVLVFLASCKQVRTTLHSRR